MLNNVFKEAYEEVIDINELLQHLAKENGRSKITERDVRNKRGEIIIDKEGFAKELLDVFGISVCGVKANRKEMIHDSEVFNKSVALIDSIDPSNVDSWMNINRISWEIYKKKIDSVLIEEDFNNINKLITKIDDSIKAKEVHHRGIPVLNRNKYVLKTIIDGIDYSHMIEKTSLKQYKYMTDINGVVSCYIDMLFCKSVTNADCDDIKLLLEKAYEKGFKHKESEYKYMLEYSKRIEK